MAPSIFWFDDAYTDEAAAQMFVGVRRELNGVPNDGTYEPNLPIVMGEAGATTLPAPPPVDVAKCSGTWYEQGSSSPSAW